MIIIGIILLIKDIVHFKNNPKDHLKNAIIRCFDVFDQNKHYNNKLINNLENAGAGIFLGKPKDLFNVIIVECVKNHKLVSEIGIGHIGRIIFKNKNFKNWTFSDMLGFVDECGNCWCCGFENDTVEYCEEKFYPYCIEPMFEAKWFIKKSAIVLFENIPVLVVEPIFLFKIFFTPCKNLILKMVIKFAKNFEKLQKLQKFFVLKYLPVKHDKVYLDRNKIIQILNKRSNDAK